MEPIVPMFLLVIFVFLAWYFNEIIKDLFQSDP